jgi:hypothetical protein
MVTLPRCGKRPFHRTLELLLELDESSRRPQTGALRIYSPRNLIRGRIFRVDNFPIDCFWHGFLPSD